MKLPGMPDLPNMDGLVDKGETVLDTLDAQLPRFVDAVASIGTGLHRIAAALENNHA